MAKIEQIAAAKGCTPSQLTLAWLLAQGDDVVTIPGTRSKARFDENTGAMAVHLSEAEVTQISAAVPKGAVSGPRYPAAGMDRVFI